MLILTIVQLDITLELNFISSLFFKFFIFVYTSTCNLVFVFVHVYTKTGSS